MFADMLDAPISKLTVSKEVNLCQNFFNCLTLLCFSIHHFESRRSVSGEKGKANLFILNAILENILNNKTSCFTEGYFVPHTTKSLIYFGHYLRRLATPSQLKEFLPNMACIPMNDGFWNSAKEFMNHHSFILFRDTIKGLLNDMTSKRIHAQIQGIAANSICNGNNLFRGTMLKTPLHKKITEAIHHERISLIDD